MRERERERERWREKERDREIGRKIRTFALYTNTHEQDTQHD